jgi:peptidoglycan/LPS O-acetylase OafA/YrhL
VVANQLIETVTEGHLFAAWIGLWAVGFALMALLAAPASRFVADLRRRLAKRRAARLAEEQDRRYWQAAIDDPRLMADIRAAMGNVGG